MNTINITTELCQEDRKRIDDLTGAITLLASVIGSALPKQTQESIITEPQHPADAPATHLEVVQPEPAGEEPKAETPAEPVADPAPEVEPIIISLAEFQKAVTLAVSKGQEAKKAVKAVINKYAPSVSGVPEDKRAEVVAELSKL